MRGKYALAFDIGGSKLVTGIIDGNGKVLAAVHTEWHELTERSVIQEALRSGRDILSEFRDNIDCVGAAIPGLADPEKGVWIEACFSGINDVPVADILSEEFSVPVHIDNDVNLCAVAEAYCGACKETNDFIWLQVSNGCGGALFIDGELCRGPFAGAGELGHIVVEENGHECKCGSRGCLEAHAAGPAIVRRYKESGGGAPVSGAGDVAGLATDGDPIAIQVFADTGRYLGKAVAAAVNTVNPGKVVIGGGVAQSYDLFEDTLLETVDRRIYKKANPELKIQKTEIGYYAPLIGAGVAALGKAHE